MKEKKMGKTAKGALWLDPKKDNTLWILPILEKYWWPRCWKLFSTLTFLPMDEVRRLGALKDAAINEAKKF